MPPIPTGHMRTSRPLVQTGRHDLRTWTPQRCMPAAGGGPRRAGRRTQSSNRRCACTVLCGTRCSRGGARSRSSTRLAGADGTAVHRSRGGTTGQCGRWERGAGEGKFASTMASNSARSQSRSASMISANSLCRGSTLRSGILDHSQDGYTGSLTDTFLITTGEERVKCPVKVRRRPGTVAQCGVPGWIGSG